MSGFPKYAVQALALCVIVSAAMLCVFVLAFFSGYSAHVHKPMSERVDAWAVLQDRINRGESETLVLAEEAARTYRPDLCTVVALLLVGGLVAIIVIGFLELWWMEEKRLAAAAQQQKPAGGDGRPHPSGRA